jgi:hypothetical protein
MTLTEWSARFIFRRLGLTMLLAMATILYIACSGSTNRAEEARQKEATRRILDAQQGNADTAIRKYTDSQTQTKKPAKKENH